LPEDKGKGKGMAVGDWSGGMGDMKGEMKGNGKGDGSDAWSPMMGMGMAGAGAGAGMAPAMPAPGMAVGGMGIDGAGTSMVWGDSGMNLGGFNNWNGGKGGDVNWDGAKGGDANNWNCGKGGDSNSWASGKGGGGSWDNGQGGYCQGKDGGKDAGGKGPTPGKPNVAEEMGTFQGIIKTFNPKNGYGFIECPGLKQLGVTNDVFLHHQQLGDFTVGACVQFTCYMNRNGQPQAKDLADPQGDAKRMKFGE